MNKTIACLFFSPLVISCMSLNKRSSYDSAVHSVSSSQKEIVETLRGVANLKKDDFSFLTEKMKNVIDSYRELNSKLMGIEQKIDRLIANKKINSTSSKKEESVLVEDIKSDTLLFSEDSLQENTEVSPSSKKAQEPLDQDDLSGVDHQLSSLSQAKKLYKDKSWQSAISEFQAYRDKYPKGDHFLEATYLMGESFKNLKMIPEANVFYEEIIKKSPKSSWAQKAKQNLKK